MQQLRNIVDRGGRAAGPAVTRCADNADRSGLEEARCADNADRPARQSTDRVGRAEIVKFKQLHMC